MSNIPIFVGAVSEHGEPMKINVAAISRIVYLYKEDDIPYSRVVFIGGDNLVIQGTAGDIFLQIKEYVQRYIEAAKGTSK